MPRKPALRFRAKGWLELEGRVVAGEGRISLLESIQREGSITAAARAEGMSYRHAWGQIKRMESVVGQPLVISQPGGRSGGRSQLTSTGLALIRAFRAGHEVLRKDGFVDQ